MLQMVEVLEVFEGLKDERMEVGRHNFPLGHDQEQDECRALDDTDFDREVVDHGVVSSKQIGLEGHERSSPHNVVECHRIHENQL